MYVGFCSRQPMLRKSYILLVVAAALSGWNGRPLTDRWPPSRVARSGLVGGSEGYVTRALLCMFPIVFSFGLC